MSGAQLARDLRARRGADLNIGRQPIGGIVGDRDGLFLVS